MVRQALQPPNRDPTRPARSRSRLASEVVTGTEAGVKGSPGLPLTLLVATPAHGVAAGTTVRAAPAAERDTACTLAPVTYFDA